MTTDADIRALVDRLRKRLEVPYEKTCLAADALERLLAERTRDTARICDLVSDVARLEQERDDLTLRCKITEVQLAEVERERYALRADAERYRWLKAQRGLSLTAESMKWTRSDGSTFVSTHCLAAGDTQFSAAPDLDQTIDQARAVQAVRGASDE